MRRLLALTLAFGLLSCNNNDTPVDPPKGSADVKLALRQASVERGDTAWITLHVSPLPFASATILNLGDGTSVQFKSSMRVLDTLVTHSFAREGSYQITASAVTDGDTTATSTIPLTIYDLAPRIVLTSDKAAYLPGDTVRLSVHAEDPTLTAGSIDFRDGAIINFSGLRRTFDTTLKHVYSADGSYAVQASFGDGELTGVQAIAILVHPPIRSFRCDLSVGMVWRFSYREVDLDRSISGKDYERWGIHEWRILGLTVSGADTLYQASETRRDSVHYVAWTYGGSTTIDTLYAKNEDLPFTITKSPKSIFFDWPSTVISDSVKFMPRVVPYSTPDSVLVYWRLQDWYSIFKENIGPVRSHWIDGGNNPHGEDLSLLEFIKP